MGTCATGQATGDSIAQADCAVEWVNTTDPITTLRLFAASDFAAGSRFTVLGRT